VGRSGPGVVPGQLLPPAFGRFSYQEEEKDGFEKIAMRCLDRLNWRRTMNLLFFVE
jgi:hypothetical protein